MDISVGVVSSLVRVGQLARTGAGAARIAWTGLRTVAGGLAVAGVVFDAVCIPFDCYVLLKGSYDIHKHRSSRGQKSNSNQAKKVEKIIKQLKEHKDTMSQVQDFFVVDDSE